MKHATCLLRLSASRFSFEQLLQLLLAILPGIMGDAIMHRLVEFVDYTKCQHHIYLSRQN